VASVGLASEVAAGGLSSPRS